MVLVTIMMMPIIVRRQQEEPIMKAMTKDRYYDKRCKKDAGHWEGRYWCDCLTRGIRNWLGIKLYARD